MQRFIDLCEKHDPNGDMSKWDLLDFLKEKGINASSVRDTDMIYVDTGEKTIALTVSVPQEEEEVEADYGTYNVNREVETLASKADKGLKGMAKKAFGRPSQKAQKAIKDREKVASKAVDVYQRKTQKLQDDLRNVQ